MKEFWNERYSSEEYGYGIAPNEYFKDEIKNLSPGKILLPADGEGRNSVFAAKLGWQVTAFDFSEAGRKKALDLAIKSGVTIDYQLAGYEDFEAPHEDFHCLALIYAHPPEGQRREIFRKLVQFLRPGGTLILEGFAKEQLNYTSGGPKNPAMLFSKEELEEDFRSLKKVDIESLTTALSEGPYHQGTSAIIRVKGIK